MFTFKISRGNKHARRRLSGCYKGCFYFLSLIHMLIEITPLCNFPREFEGNLRIRRENCLFYEVRLLFFYFRRCNCFIFIFEDAIVCFTLSSSICFSLVYLHTFICFNHVFLIFDDVDVTFITFSEFYIHILLEWHQTNVLK